MNVIYYISGHGYGHAVRSIEIMAALKKNRPEMFFYIRSSAPRWLFDVGLEDGFKYYPLEIDVGTAQDTSFTVNREATLRSVLALYDRKSEILASELQFIKSTQIDCILADIPPLAFDFASAAGIPAIGIANFSWDWIYSGYAAQHQGFHDIIKMIKHSYGKCPLLLRLPFCGDLSAFPVAKDIPLVARKPRKPREEIIKQLGIPTSDACPLVLLGLRREDLGIVNFDAVGKIADKLFITFDLDPKIPNCLSVPSNRFYFPDLLDACDIVISKPGYGIVSEAIACKTPIIYTSRDDFLEYDILVNGLKEFAVSSFLDRQDFQSGNWDTQLNQLLGSGQCWKDIELNGAETASDMILQFIQKPA